MAIKHKKIMVKELQEKLGLKNRREALKVFDTVVDIIKEQILQYGECWIVNFGKFKLIERPARSMWNPKLQREIYQPGMKILKFKVARPFFRKINE